MDEQKTYRPKKVCEEVGISHRQLGYWGMIGVIKPTKKAHGSKIFNHYTDKDIETLKRVKRLTEEGFFVSKAAEKVHKNLFDQPGNQNGNGEGLKEKHSEGLSSSLYLEVRLNEELAEMRGSYRPLSCMAVQIFFPPTFKSHQEKNNLLYQLSKTLATHKKPSEAICYDRDSIFLWLLPNRTLDETISFSDKIKRAIEEVQWEIPKGNLKLKTLFGFSGYASSSKNENDLFKEAIRNLQANPRSQTKHRTDNLKGVSINGSRRSAPG